MTGGGRAGWWPTIASGLLWAVAVSVLDTLGEPLEDLSLADLARFSIAVSLQWFLVGQLWAVTARLAEARGRPVLGYVAALPISSAIAVSTSIFVQRIAPVDAGPASSWLITNASSIDIVGYVGWENAFFGAIYMIGYVATRRGVRLRQRMAETMRARGQADMLLREAELRAYRGQLQPNLMIEALACLRGLTRRNAAAADLLLDRLVTFLRETMPAIRTGRSTLMAELTTLKTYCALRTLLPGEERSVDVIWIEPIADMPFPPLVLLPTFEAAANALPPGGQMTLRAWSSAAESRLSLVTSAPVSLAASVTDQLRAGLRLTFGGGVQVSAGHDGGPALDIRFSLTPPDLASALQGDAAMIEGARALDVELEHGASR